MSAAIPEASVAVRATMTAEEAADMAKYGRTYPPGYPEGLKAHFSKKRPEIQALDAALGESFAEHQKTLESGGKIDIAAVVRQNVENARKYNPFVPEEDNERAETFANLWEQREELAQETGVNVEVREFTPTEFETGVLDFAKERSAVTKAPVVVSTAIKNRILTPKPIPKKPQTTPGKPPPVVIAPVAAMTRPAATMKPPAPPPPSSPTSPPDQVCNNFAMRWADHFSGGFDEAYWVCNRFRQTMGQATASVDEVSEGIMGRDWRQYLSGLRGMGSAAVTAGATVARSMLGSPSMPTRRGRRPMPIPANQCPPPISCGC